MSKPDNIVTVFSDASVLKGATGCGFWVKSRSVNIEGSKSLDTSMMDPPMNSNMGELWGISVALKAAREAHTGEIIIVLQCDSLAALGAMVTFGYRFAKTSDKKAGPRLKMTQFEENLQHGIKALPEVKDIWLKHVKGHSGGCSRTHINNRTDRLAGHASKARAKS